MEEGIAEDSAPRITGSRTDAEEVVAAVELGTLEVVEEEVAVDDLDSEEETVVVEDGVDLQELETSAEAMAAAVAAAWTGGEIKSLCGVFGHAPFRTGHALSWSGHVP